MSSSPGRSGILVRLKQETAGQHVNLERSLDLLRQDLDLASYTDLLSRFHRIHSSWEPLAERLLGRLFPAWPESRTRLPLLRRDLGTLGYPLSSATPVHFEELTDTAAALGAMYVVEGSTLGGQLLIRHFQQTLGVTPENGGAYFNGYGPRTGEMWREFSTELQEYAHRTGSGDRIVQGARSMFDTMHRELCGVAA